MKKAKLWRIKNNGLVCTACKHYCRITENSTGICATRMNIKNRLFLLTHSLASSYHVDPIEKKPLYHFLPGSEIFSFGTFGCNFGCQFCQNFDISQSPKDLKREIMKNADGKNLPDKLISFIEKNSLKLPPRKIVELTLSQKCPSIAFTYNEPAIFTEYAFDTMKLAKKHKIRGVFVSSGYETKESLDLLEGYIDAYNIDIKGGSEEFYHRNCHTKLSCVLETVREIYERKKWLEITTLLIPGINTDKKDIKFIAKFIASLSKDIPWHVTSFYPQYKMIDIPPTSFSELKKAYEIGKSVGLNYVYTGNIPNEDTESTYCPECKTRLIKREGYVTEIENLKKRKLYQMRS